MRIAANGKLYHGTTDNLLSSFQSKLLNARYWRHNRDFGEGFYTTSSIIQARKWAMHLTDTADEQVNPCVLEMIITSFPGTIEPLIFLNTSIDWAKFILEHRTIKKKGEDPCIRHPDLIAGPMADGDTGNIVKECVRLNKNVNWFYDQITRSQAGRRLDTQSLGNQIAFCSENWEGHLRMAGYHTYLKGRWIFHEGSSAQSL